MRPLPELRSAIVSCKQKTAYELATCLDFRRVLFRSYTPTQHSLYTLHAPAIMIMTGEIRSIDNIKPMRNTGVSTSRLLKNVFEAGYARQKWPKKRSLLE